MRFNRQTSPKQDVPRLTAKLWDFTGTALLNLFMFLFLVTYLSPLPFMIIASLTPHQQFLDSNAPILPSKRVTFNYDGKDRIVYQVPTEQGIKHWALYKPSRQSSQFIDPQNPGAGPIVWQGSMAFSESRLRVSSNPRQFQGIFCDRRYSFVFQKYDHCRAH